MMSIFSVTLKGVYFVNENYDVVSLLYQSNLYYPYIQILLLFNDYLSLAIG